uniref:ABC transmembrane type-2 domain-containing protein n=1 Tax=Pterothamnion crispum TaxID=1550583 RepID=A0A4D6X3E2_9FLOR|nr:hypothetical protein [Pterothamnion crispum]
MKIKKSLINLTPNQIIEQANLIPYIIIEIIALTKRLYLQIIRRPSTFIAGMIQPLLWLFLFGALFQNTPVNLFTNNIKYEQFLSPGIIIFTSFNGSINAGLPLMFDREFGFLNRLLISPLAIRDSLLISSLISIITITLFQTFTIISFNIFFLKSITNIYSFHTIIQIIILTTLNIATISICLAFILPGHIEFLALLLLINLPTLFSSTALAPLSFMPYWLQIIACLNPITYAIEILRYICSDQTINYSTKIIKTVWFNFSLYDSILILVIINIISFIVVKYIIKYKYE